MLNDLDEDDDDDDDDDDYGESARVVILFFQPRSPNGENNVRGKWDQICLKQISDFAADDPNIWEFVVTCTTSSPWKRLGDEVERFRWHHDGAHVMK